MAHRRWRTLLAARALGRGLHAASRALYRSGEWLRSRRSAAALSTLDRRCALTHGRWRADLGSRQGTLAAGHRRAEVFRADAGVGSRRAIGPVSVERLLYRRWRPRMDAALRF